MNVANRTPRTSWLGWLGLSLATSLATLVASSASAQDQDGPGPDAEQPAPQAPGIGAGGGAGGGSPEAVNRLFSILRGEPTIRQVQRAALQHYRLEPERVNSIVSSAHLKGLIPELEASYDLSMGSNLSNTRDGLYPILPSLPENPNPENYKERMRGQQTQNTFRVRAVFNLDRLVFNSEALDARALNSMGENLVREVTTMYYSRRRLIGSLILNPPQSDSELFHELQRLDELTSTLDALTGGNFAARAWQWDQDREEAGAAGDQAAPARRGAPPRR